MEEATEKTEESLQTQNIDDVYTDIFDESQGQESALLKAQRYLNIFRQIHIFTPEKRKEFDTSLLLIDSRTKEILASIPGGKVLLDHLHKLQEQNGLEHDTTPFISAKTALGNEEQISSTPINTAQAATAVDVGTPIELNSTFAKDLAQSLAAALKVNNMIPQQQNNDLPRILNNSLGTYAANLQKMTEEFFTKHLQHFDDMQTRWLSQFHEQINLQNDYQNKFLSQQTQQIQLLNQQQSKQIQQLQSQNSQQFEQLQARSVSSHSMGTRQLNTQTNNANSTTINNVNFDPQSLRLGDITSAIIETFKETNKQQLLTLKEMGENLSKSIIQSQRELSETILKARPHIHIEQSSKENENYEPIQKDIETIQPVSLNMDDNKPINLTKNIPLNIGSEDKKNKNTDKSVQTKKENKPSNSDNAFKPQNKEANTPANKLTKEALQPKQDVKSEKDKNKNNKNKPLNPLLNDVEEVEISTIFSHQNNQPTEKISKEKNSDKPEPKKENKEVIENNNPHALHSYDDAMQLIKNALNDKEPVSLDDIETSAVSLESQDSSFNTSADDDLWKSFTSTNQENADTSSSEAEWEYADENGNPIEDDNTEWEYVDENGNPIEDDNTEWEYVDENGNPIEDDNTEWEYVDENGNPIEDDNAEWEYVDENGNPIEDDNAEWEYVDENGNPIETDNTKWEYVDENGNQTAKTNK